MGPHDFKITTRKSCLEKRKLGVVEKQQLQGIEKTNPQGKDSSLKWAINTTLGVKCVVLNFRRKLNHLEEV